MHNLFYWLPDPMLIVEFEHNRWYIRDINQAFSLLSGYKKRELVDVDPAGLLQEGFSFNALMTQIPEDSELIIEWELITKSTQPTLVRLTCRKFHIEQQSRYMIICKNLSEDKWIDDFGADNKIVMTINATEKFNITDTRRYYTPVKYQSSTLVNQNLFDYVFEDHRKSLRRVMDYARNNGTTEQIQIKMLIGDHTYLTSAVIKPFYWGNKSFKDYLIVLTDLNQHTHDEDSSYKLRLLMLGKNISATSLSQSTLISLTTISKIRNGKIKKPQRLTAELIAGELGVKPEMIWSSFKR
ncbi:MAG: PAS domain-containing protein [Candidatus Pristimantibacillus sp.]